MIFEGFPFFFCLNFSVHFICCGWFLSRLFLFACLFLFFCWFSLTVLFSVSRRQMLCVFWQLCLVWCFPVFSVSMTFCFSSLELQSFHVSFTSDRIFLGCFTVSFLLFPCFLGLLLDHSSSFCSLHGCCVVSLRGSPGFLTAVLVLWRKIPGNGCTPTQQLFLTDLVFSIWVTTAQTVLNTLFLLSRLRHGPSLPPNTPRPHGPDLLFRRRSVVLLSPNSRTRGSERTHRKQSKECWDYSVFVGLICSAQSLSTLLLSVASKLIAGHSLRICCHPSGEKISASLRPMIRNKTRGYFRKSYIYVSRWTKH